MRLRGLSRTGRTSELTRTIFFPREEAERLVWEWLQALGEAR